MTTGADVTAGHVVPELRVTGRAWVFGDRMNTDDMYPASVMSLPVEQAAKAVFASSRPGWADEVRPGDVVVGGTSFGIGSSRPVALLFRALGVACVVADGFNSLFERNCVNYGLPVLAVPGVTAAVREGDEITVDVEAATVTTAAGAELRGRPYPELVLRIVRRGGLVAQLTQDGLITDPAGAAPARAAGTPLTVQRGRNA